jgi:hypothetical protein
MAKALLILITLIFVTCDSENDIPIEFPSGGYAYPEHVDKKSENFLYYTLIDSLPSDDSFRIAYYGDYLLKALNEPNLSIKKQAKVIFRFIYTGPMMQPLVINFIENEIIIKEGIKGFIYPEQDENKLTKIERGHFNLLKWRFPLTGNIKNVDDIKYIDSFVKTAPQLLNPEYYLSLLKKTELPITDKFSYSTKRIKISKDKFRKLVTLINTSGYWNLPFESECKDIPTDAGGYSLEANTQNKYNVVTEIDCGDQASKFKIMCHKLLTYAKVENKLFFFDDPVKVDSAVDLK